MWSLFPHNCCVPWGFCKWTDTIEAGCFWCQRQRKRRGILTLLLAVYLYLIHDLVWSWKMVSVSVCYLFYQPMDEKIKTLTLHFSAKENPKWRRHCLIGQLCCNMTSKRSIDWFLASSQAWSFFTRAFA